MQAPTARPRTSGLKWFLWLVGVPLLLFAGYLAFVVNWAYSDGERAGYLQKFSHKGWICKTWEGELAMTTVPGVAPVLWNFTVKHEAVAAQLNAMAGKRVVVHYEEHRGIPTQCYGETNHFVSRVSEIEDIGVRSRPVEALQEIPQ
ncbi:MAG: hypothetical protein B7Z35_05005 [Hydrogenophilales bacterium 12-61-10]|nr:MAG: hypothetical protein B7Z35_05005 [Hydrogenophilales bacterium 12-61-10]